ncbi:unnamed protein product [Meganyctiphanes norvegica]|uniref:Cuticle protein n=1 Tax=Meganyctiphanes norvegica TaxID=48144 RepID=A0AAV2Q812_MEGNR
MRQLVLVASLLGLTLGRPQGAPRNQQLVNDAPARGNDNLFTKIISLKTIQDGADFGHNLVQEDGIGSGVKIGPDGLQYGFYTYVEQDGNRVRVNWRAGEGVGYEVLSTEGLNTETLGNLRATQNATPDPFYVETAPVTPNPNRAVHHNPVIINQHDVPVNTFKPPVVTDFDFAPNQFDYPSQLDITRTNTGFSADFRATK